MNIAIDIMGGDYAPEEALKGVKVFFESEINQDVNLVLIGNSKAAEPFMDLILPYQNRYTFIESTQVIGMNEHPTKALKEKPDSSIAIGYKIMAQRKADAFIGAGNTGAMLVGAVLNVKNIPGVIRPAIGASVPKLSGGYGILLDVGAVSDCKPEMLSQFGLLGSLFAEHVVGTTAPKVALLNIGEEEEKGNALTQASYPLLKQNQRIRFIGNIEGRNVFDDEVDVIVCDGFTGNVVLKMAESFYMMTQRKGLKDEFFDRFNYEIYGGTPILGVNAPVVIGHGISNPKAIEMMIMLSKTMIESDIIEKIKSAFNE